MRAAKIIPTGTNTFVVGKVTVDKASRTVRIPAVVNMREQVIEYALVTQSGKTHESLFATEASPTDVHVAALLVGLAPGNVLDQTNTIWVIPELSAVTIAAAWQIEGRTHRHALSELIGLAEAEPGVITRVLDPGPWFYNGSRILEGGEFVAQQGGSIVSLIFDPDALVNNPHPDRDNDDIHFPNTPLLPPVGTPVTVEFRPARTPAGMPSGSRPADSSPQTKP